MPRVLINLEVETERDGEASGGEDKIMQGESFDWRNQIWVKTN